MDLTAGIGCDCNGARTCMGLSTNLSLDQLLKTRCSKKGISFDHITTLRNIFLQRLSVIRVSHRNSQ